MAPRPDATDPGRHLRDASDAGAPRKDASKPGRSHGFEHDDTVCLPKYSGARRALARPEDAAMWVAGCSTPLRLGIFWARRDGRAS